MSSEKEESTEIVPVETGCREGIVLIEEEKKTSVSEDTYTLAYNPDMPIYSRGIDSRAGDAVLARAKRISINGLHKASLVHVGPQSEHEHSAHAEYNQQQTNVLKRKALSRHPRESPYFSGTENADCEQVATLSTIDASEKGKMRDFNPSPPRSPILMPNPRFEVDLESISSKHPTISANIVLAVLKIHLRDRPERYQDIIEHYFTVLPSPEEGSARLIFSDSVAAAIFVAEVIEVNHVLDQSGGGAAIRELLKFNRIYAKLVEPEDILPPGLYDGRFLVPDLSNQELLASTSASRLDDASNVGGSGGVGA
ncbi:hypothetical protein VNI00_007141 [Paramarasmius palmivorus]|uniref:Uncharacterized protein n=1 Tax=Paramarasmius palmivorus TaxID=297713 RepID=A0AAW0D339_9AGAR